MSRPLEPVNPAVAAAIAAVNADRPRPIAVFSYLELRDRDRRRCLVLADSMATTEAVTFIDWRTAPIAELFFTCTVGDDYELEIGDRSMTGTVVARTLLTENGVPLDLDDLDLRPRDRAARARPSTPIHVPLDATQERAVAHPSGHSLLVLGEAGFGKTTVALHRIAALARGRRAPTRTLVLVPTPGLRRLYTEMLQRLGVTAARVATFDDWLAAEARRLFPDLPKRTSEDTSAAVIRVKRHPALREVIGDIAGRKERLSAGRSVALTRAVHEDLLHLFGDRALLERVANAAQGAITARALAAVIAHTKVQFSPTTEQAHRHVDSDRLATVDGRAIDDGTPSGDANTIDLEDCPVMFEINRVRAGGDHTPAGRLSRYDHIVIDEAQELAPLELAVIGRALGKGGFLTVAGDHHQQTDDTAVFTGWPHTMAELGAEHETVTLAESYRCPESITTLARGLFAPHPPPSAPDPALAWSRFSCELHLVAAMTASLSELADADERATVAVVCHSASAARRLAPLLDRGVSAVLASGGAVDLSPGIQVTSVADVKGLEFDYVVIPDASASNYPATSSARRALYVATTRTIHQLWLCTIGAWSPLLQPAAEITQLAAQPR